MAVTVQGVDSDCEDHGASKGYWRSSSIHIINDQKG